MCAAGPGSYDPHLLDGSGAPRLYVYDRALLGGMDRSSRGGGPRPDTGALLIRVL